MKQTIWKTIDKEQFSCCEKCFRRDCEDEIEKTTETDIRSCPCHRGLPLCPRCKEFACQCKTGTSGVYNLRLDERVQKLEEQVEKLLEVIRI